MRALALCPAATSFRRELACPAAKATWLARCPSSKTALAPAPASGRLEVTWLGSGSGLGLGLESGLGLGS
eukprot:scaffold5432_cov45-Phaeocystis_antarctica.AAC.1